MDVIEDDAPKKAYVVFDTENNGLFVFRDKETKETVPADADCQPRLASICLMMTDENGREIMREKHYIKPDGWSMNDHDHRSIEQNKPTASEVNGLTDDFLMEHGVPVTDVLAIWNNLVDDGLTFTAYNAQHDMKQMRAELRRAGMSDRFEETKNSCLMRSLKPYKEDGLPVKGWGMIKLQTACEFFGITGLDWHEAEADTVGAQQILIRLLQDKRLLEPKVHYAKPAS